MSLRNRILVWVRCLCLKTIVVVLPHPLYRYRALRCRPMSNILYGNGNAVCMQWGKHVVAALLTQFRSFLLEAASVSVSNTRLWSDDPCTVSLTYEIILFLYNHDHTKCFALNIHQSLSKFCLYHGYVCDFILWYRDIYKTREHDWIWKRK